jgi:hypothetical protein
VFFITERFYRWDILQKQHPISPYDMTAVIKTLLQPDGILSAKNIQKSTINILVTQHAPFLI